MASELYGLQNFISTLESWGLTDVMLPFLLIFTLFFAILEKSKVLGDDKKNINVVVSLVIALTVIVPHVMGSYPSENLDPVSIMNKALPSMSVVVVAILMMLILIGIFGGDARLFGVAFSGWVVFVSLALIIIIFGASAGWWQGGSWMEQFFGSEAVALIIMLLVFGIIVAFIVGGDKEKEERGRFYRIGEDMKNIFGGGSKK